jgi:ABC-type Fe3+-hydroxamate transport system substrate-binding protein
MKKTVLLTLLSALVFAACSPTAPEPDENQLVHSSAKGTLTKTDSTRTVNSVVTCGCPFPVYISGAGDTTIIKYSLVSEGDTIVTHPIKVTGLPFGLAKGTYTSWLALEKPDFYKGYLRDTVRDTLMIN